MDNLFNSDITEVKEFIAVNITNEFDTISPYLNNALEDVLPVLSPEMYAKLLGDYLAESTDEDHLALLRVTQRALVHFAYLRYQPFGSVQVTDRGLTQEKDQAMPFEQKMFSDSCRKEGYAALNSMLKLLLANRDVYTEWSGSGTYQELLAPMIHTVEEFSEFRVISGIDTLFALRPAIMHVQKKIIRANIGAELYDLLAEEVFEDDLSPDNKELLPYVKEALAHLALEYGLPQLGWEMTSQGLRAITEKPIFRSGRNEERGDRFDTFAIGMDAKEKGELALRELRKFLNKNASTSKYSSYFNDESLFEDGSPNPDLDQSTGSFWAIRS